MNPLLYLFKFPGSVNFNVWYALNLGLRRPG